MSYIDSSFITDVSSFILHQAVQLLDAEFFCKK